MTFIRPWMRSRVPLFAFAIALAAFCGLASSPVPSTPLGASEAVVRALAERGLGARSSDVLWLHVARSALLSRVSASECLVRAARAGEPADYYLVRVRTSPEGAPLDLGAVLNLTNSVASDDALGVLSPTARRFAYAAFSDHFVSALHVLDLAGPTLPEDFTTTQRIQTRVSQLQQTGRSSGIAHDAYTFAIPQGDVSIHWRDDATLAIDVSQAHATIHTAKHEVDAPEALAMRISPYERARPAAVVPWAVDRVRATWFGEERMQWVKAIAFTAREWKTDFFSRFAKDNSAAEVAKDLGGVNSGKAVPVVFKDPEIGWPPEPMAPRLRPALPGEGLWIPLESDPFLTHVEGAPPAFVTSFIRTDARRPGTRIYVTLWDPRQIALHMEAGTVEPQSSTGEAGTGMIPRTPELVKRVVAGFNGGFQAMHGEFGMQANGILYLPPKPFAATVAEMVDGSTGFGSWPSSSNVPSAILSYRQNLTALVENGQINPWGRTWWGGTPIGWRDNIHTTRSGLCLTKESYVAYFFGIDISPETLGEGMLAARCTYGVHLDMNPGLVGFEFYNVDHHSHWQPLSRPLQGDWESEGMIKELPDFRYRARRMIKSMAHMNFPQYIQRHGRDFFYLTVRDVLPGPPLPTPTDSKPPWKTKGLPQHGFPYAVATTATSLGAGVHVLGMRIDPKTVRAAPPSDEGKTVLVWAADKNEKPVGNVSLGLTSTHTFHISAKSGTDTLLTGVRFEGALSARAHAAMGINDEDGMLTWVELATGVAPSAAATKAMNDLLERSGCRERMFVPYVIRTSLGGTMTLDQKPSDILPPLARLVRVSSPGAERLFADVKPERPEVWLGLQSQRVRYFKRAVSEKRALQAADAGAQ